MSKRAVGYTRLSQKSDTSIDRQKRHIRAYADEHGFDLLDIYDDGENSSGFESEREQFQRVNDLVRGGDVDAVIVNDLRRLSRDFDTTMQLILDLRRNSVSIHTHQEGQLDLSDPMQASIEVLQAASEHESKMKEIERAREAVAERIANGYDHGPPRYGMVYNEEKTRQVPGEDFDDVEAVFRARENGKTYQEIEDEIGVPSSTAQRIVKNREWYEERRIE